MYAGKVDWKAPVSGTSRYAAEPSGFGSCQKLFSFEVRLIHRRGQLHVLPLGVILLLAAVHATLALLPGSERLRTKVDAELSRGRELQRLERLPAHVAAEARRTSCCCARCRARA